MFAKVLANAVQVILNSHKLYQKRYLTVTLIGSSGGPVEILALLFKLNPLVTELLLYDNQPTVLELASDLSQIDTGAVVRGFTSRDYAGAFEKTDIVVFPNPGCPANQTREQIFSTNAKPLFQVAEKMGKIKSQPLVAMAVDPINSTVPLIAEALDRAGKDPSKVIGMTTLDVMRATTYVAKTNCHRIPKEVKLPVIGGREGITIIPVLSQCKPPVKVKVPSTIVDLTKQIQRDGTGFGDPKLSSAYAMARFTDVLLRALAGESGIVQNAFVKSDKTDAPFFSNSILFGKNGIEENLGFGQLSDYEQQLVRCAVPVLCDQAKLGIKFAKTELGYV